MGNKVIGLWSPVASTGVTFTALNIARALSSKGLKVAVLDYDLKTPSLAIYLRFEDTAHCLDSVIPSTVGNNLHPTILETNMQKFEGFRVLIGTNTPEQAHYVAIESLEQIVEVARDIFDYVIIDSHSVIDNAGTYVALHKADVVLVIVDKNVMNIKHFDQVKNVLEASFDMGKFSLVINKSHKNIYIDKETIEDYMGIGKAVELPMLDLELVNAFNQGRWTAFMDSKQAKPYINALENLITEKIREDFKELGNAKKRSKLWLFGKR